MSAVDEQLSVFGSTSRITIISGEFGRRLYMSAFCQVPAAVATREGKVWEEDIFTKR